MSVYSLPTDNFVEVIEHYAVLQNLSMTILEYVVCDAGQTPVKDTGLQIKPNEKFVIKIPTTQTAYIRATQVTQYANEQQARVTPQGYGGFEVNVNCGCGGSNGSSGSSSGGTSSTPYTLPIASQNTLGGIKVGDNLTIDSNGKLSAVIPSGSSTTPAQYTLPVATTTTLGGVKVGNGLSINDNGVLSTIERIGGYETNKQYNENDVIVVAGNIYKCNGDYVSTGDFDVDLLGGYWQCISNSGSAGSGGYTQVTKVDVTAPLTVSLGITPTKAFIKPPVEVLKRDAGEVNVEEVEATFSADENTNYTSNRFVTVDNTLHEVTEVKYKTNLKETITSGKIYESEEIDPSDYKSISEVKV